MILQALVEHYEDLAAQNKLARPGWSDANISYALYINNAGELEQAVSLKSEVERGKKQVMVPRAMTLPAAVKRANKIVSNFLWDNSSYILGIDEKGKPQRSVECFNACKTLHHRLLDDVDSAAARAVLSFFDHWDPAKAREHPALADKLMDILEGANLVFRYNSAFLQEDPQIRTAWQTYYDSSEGGPELVCLVTGKKGPAQAVHPAIRGVAGAQSSGAALVSFNADAFCSYGHKQNLNAPMSKYAAFAYTSAVNHLLTEREYVSHIGDTTVVFWASGGEQAYQDAFSDLAMPSSDTVYSDNDLQGVTRNLCQGKPVAFKETKLDPNTTFYILGLSPNAGRLSVRFFLKDTFGEFVRNVQAHQERLEIVRPAFDRFEVIPPWKLLEETTNRNSKDKTPSSGMAGEILRAILSNTPYPATLLNGVTLRIRAEREITREKAAILKAYYLKSPHPDVPQEVLTVSLNPDSTNIPYTLGRQFSVLEAIQSASYRNAGTTDKDQNAESDTNATDKDQYFNDGINATIKDQYFNSASATPSRVFPHLINLAQKHLRKLKPGLRTFYDRQLRELCDKLGETLPDHLSMPEIAAFQLGYYHQTQERYRKKKSSGDEGNSNEG